MPEVKIFPRPIIVFFSLEKCENMYKSAWSKFSSAYNIPSKRWKFKTFIVKFHQRISCKIAFGEDT